MEPQLGNDYINIPVTFDYHGGRGGNKKNKIIATIAIIIVVGIVMTGVILNEELFIYKKLLIAFLAFYIGLVLLRFLIFRELYFSDIYEELLESDLVMDITQIWQIFEVGNEYPYICYYKNGYKGIFVKMEKGTVTGKTIENEFAHYDAIGEAYNLAHSLNMNIVHVDYMDNVGKDTRLQHLYGNLSEVKNPDMQAMLIDIYDNWQLEMSLNYASYDIYLFLTRDRLELFIDNVQAVVNTMLGGNFITYRVMNRNDISNLCTALFNLHNFSVNDACEKALSYDVHNDIVPIKITHADGTVEVLNKTREEKREELAERVRKQEEAKHDAKVNRQKAKLRKKGLLKEPDLDNKDIELFDDNNVKNTDSDNKTDNKDDIDLF